MIGRSIGRFVILEELGRGGMASVWKARDRLLGRFVALKVLNPELAQSPESRRRFRHEAEVDALLEHPSIVPVYEAGEDDGVSYLVMRLVEGETLAQLVLRRLPPIKDVLQIARTVADALGFAHARGVIHRDVTSRNVMVTPAGGVWVLDFGLARVMGETVSSSGHLVGTVAFLAPESLRGERTDARSDLYSLGVVIYHALTGSLPFRGDRTEVVAYSSLHATVEPPSRLRPEVPPAIDELVMRLLAREAAERPASAGTLVDMLDHECAALGAKVPESPAPEIAGAMPADRNLEDISTKRIVREPGLAERWASGQVHAYVAVLPVECPDAVDDDGARTRFLSELAETTRAGLAASARVHVVAMGATLALGEDSRSFARRVGANLVLGTRARFSGSVVRITFALVDAEHDTQVGGGVVDGSTFQPFDVEDRVAAAVRQALGIGIGDDLEPRKRPGDPAAIERFAQARSYLRRFDQEASVDGAIALLEGLLRTEGDSAVVHATLARAYLHKYRGRDHRIWEARAAQACERATILDPRSPEVMLAVGELHAATGRHVEALCEFDRALALEPEFYEAHLARARSLDGSGRADEAESASRRAIELAPEDWRGHHNLALVLFHRGRYRESVDPWRKVTELVPDNANAYRNLGSALFHLDQYDDAIAAFHRCNEIRPEALAYTNLGTVLFALERFDECASAFEKAVALNDSDPRTWGNLGNACRRIAGREARAREALERAIGLVQERLDREPGEGEDWARMASWLANLGRLEEARGAIRRALEMSPDDVHTMVEAGQVFVQLGERAEGIKWIRLAVQSGYGADSLRRSLTLKVLAGDAEFDRILEQGPRKRGPRHGSTTQNGRPS